MRKAHRHLYLFEVAANNGVTNNIKAWAKTRTPKRTAEIVLTEEDVKRSMELHGAGNTQKCSAAICVIRNEDEFSHRVVGYIDFYYKTCFVASKLNPETHLPSECYRYVHNFGWVARLNDKKGGGQKELLAIIQRKGPIVIRLHPRKRTDWPKHGGTGRRDGTRSTRLIGAKLRHAEATLGGVPA